ncbi:hypothetical protein [Agrococcus baldri]|nr:hypothetical protein [Agrococcus baldri]
MNHVGTRMQLLRGANPAVTLFDGDEPVALASVWRVDWSLVGTGTAIVLWHAGEVTVFGDRPDLGFWLASSFVRHFPEAEGLQWSQVRFDEDPVAVELDLSEGLLATSRRLSVRIWEPMGERGFQTDAFRLDGEDHALSLRLAPCRRAELVLDGQRIAGAPRVTEDAARPQSSAFLADQEEWRR